MISYALFACRIWVRLYWKQWHLFVSDIWLLIAALSALGVVICDTFQYQAGAMSDFNTVSVALGKVSNQMQAALISSTASICRRLLIR
jgi:hypothetical protein